MVDKIRQKAASSAQNLTKWCNIIVNSIIFSQIIVLDAKMTAEKMDPSFDLTR